MGTDAQNRALCNQSLNRESVHPIEESRTYSLACCSQVVLHVVHSFERRLKLLPSRRPSYAEIHRAVGM